MPKPARYLALIAIIITLTIPLFATKTAIAAELLMLEQQGCSWCVRWHAEIGDAYPNTTQGKRAPLRILDIHKEWPEDLADIKRDRMTPTFVLVSDGKEVSRLRGYPGDMFFWVLLDEMLSQLPDKQ